MMNEQITPTSGWRVKCSICWQSGSANDSISQAVELAKEAGWITVEIQGRLATLCPACAEVMRRLESEVQP